MEEEASAGFLPFFIQRKWAKPCLEWEKVVKLGTAYFISLQKIDEMLAPTFLTLQGFGCSEGRLTCAASLEKK